MRNNRLKLVGPFSQVLTMEGLPLKGPLSDDSMEILEDAGVIVSGGIIEATGSFRELKSLVSDVEAVEGQCTLVAGLVDAHTHICWAGSRAGDYARRLSGESYTEIADKGGGIWSTVLATRRAPEDELAKLTALRANRLLSQGITTAEVKSGYGLDTRAEIKMLSAIRKADALTKATLVPTCLAAHIKPRDFTGTARQYLEQAIHQLFPIVKERQLSNRIDIYVDEGAFTVSDARFYLEAARRMGFDLTMHADQFTGGALRLAAEMQLLSADHLEVSREEDIRLLSESRVIPVVLPGSSMGLGTAFAPARRMLDAGASLAIASDWNPGSAPMGNLLMQASVMGMAERLTMAETLAAITFRASAALGLSDRGRLSAGCQADFIAFPCADYREILYSQGSLTPSSIWKNGERIYNL